MNQIHKNLEIYHAVFEHISLKMADKADLIREGEYDPTQLLSAPPRMWPMKLGIVLPHASNLLAEQRALVAFAEALGMSAQELGASLEPA